MYREIENKLSSLEEPTAFQTKTFDEALLENIELAKNILSTKDTEWFPLESDPYMKKLRVATLRQMFNQEDKKETIKQELVTVATSVDLDHLGTKEHIFRDAGEYPYINFEFTLLSPSSSDIVIPAGLILNSDDDKYKSHTVEDVIIPANSLSAIVKVELEDYIAQSDIKTEQLITELTFAVDIKQLDIFSNGATAESDDRYRSRIIKANDRKSTAGSEDSYKFFVYNSDSRINDVKVISEKVLCVDIYIASFDNNIDELMINRVFEAVNSKKVRPLGDKVSVYPAVKKVVDITATIEVFDLLKQSEIKTNIEANFKDSFFIAQNFIMSDFIRKCHIDGVYRVKSEFQDVIVSNKEIITMGTLELNFMEAVL
ncbi:MAG: baseplate J/gp47 family protein [Sulfurospirillum sp.]|nr:baseplate J/gp47 family protein [Sulfurospirillum sp.]